MLRVLRLLCRLIPARTRRGVVALFPDSWATRFYSRHIVGRQNMYSKDFIADNGNEKNVEHAMVIAKAIAEYFSPASVIDVGCGAGNLVSAFRDCGADVRGIDFATAAQDEMRRRGLTFSRIDLESDEEMSSFTDKSDLVSCFEVSEHLPEERAMPLVRFLCKIAPVVCFTAAPPGQGGIMHVNEKPASYWVDLFAGQAFSHDVSLSNDIRRHWVGEGLDDPRVRNFMIFRSDDIGGK